MRDLPRISKANQDKVLNRELEKAKEATERNNSPPVPRPSRNRNRLPALFRQYLDNLRETDDTHNQVNCAFVTGASPCCFKALDELRSVSLRELQVPMVHRGSVLVCRVITPALVRVATYVVVEDIEGDVEELELYNFQINWNDLLGKSETKVLPKSWLPEGTIMIIKEPCLKFGPTKYDITLRVDSPSDIIFVDESDEDLLASVGALKWYKAVPLSASQLFHEGNARVVKKDYKGALECYDRALRLSPNNSSLLLNKSSTLIGLNRNYEAYQAAKIVLDSGGNCSRALYRLGKSAYRMRQWDKAVDHFRALQKDFPQNECKGDELQTAMARQQESKTGKFNIDRFYREAYKERKHRLDVADYIGPIEVVDIPGKGKGIVASKDITKGTLLVVSKAFACTYPDECESFVLAANTITKRAETTTAFYNKMRVIQELQRNPHRANDVYALYAGELAREPVIPEGVIDVARVEQICSYNSFELVESEKDCSNSGEKRFAMHEDKPTALFTTPSFFNHSCLPNAHHAFYGDAMVVHAIEDRKKGEQICISYIDVQLPYKARVEKLAAFGFECHCELCILDRSDPLYEKREELVKQLDRLGPLLCLNPYMVLEKLEHLVNKLRQTFKNRKTLRLQMVAPLSMLSDTYQELDAFDESIKVLDELLDHLNEPLVYHIGAECYRAIALNNLLERRKLGFEKYKRVTAHCVKLRAGTSNAFVNEEIITSDAALP